MRLGWELGRPFPRSACSESNRVSKGRSLAGGSAATSAEIVSKATIVSASSLIRPDERNERRRRELHASTRVCNPRPPLGAGVQERPEGNAPSMLEWHSSLVTFRFGRITMREMRIGAGDVNRTRFIGLEARGLAIRRHPRLSRLPVLPWPERGTGSRCPLGRIGGAALGARNPSRRYQSTLLSTR